MPPFYLITAWSRIGYIGFCRLSASFCRQYARLACQPGHEMGLRNATEWYKQRGWFTVSHRFVLLLMIGKK